MTRVHYLIRLAVVVFVVVVVVVGLEGDLYWQSLMHSSD